MTTRSIRRWFVVHKWTSLVSTLFLLVICVTGLPLVFREEIGDWLDDSRPYAQTASDAPRIGLDQVVTTALRRYPGQIVTTVFVDDDEPQVMVGLAASWAQYNADPRSGHIMKFDAHTGAVLRDSASPQKSRIGFLPLMLHLHMDLFAGLTGELFFALMALFFVIAIVSGVVLYGPFMKRLPFGTLRTVRSTRLRWLDLHNLLGIVLTAWMAVVGATGLMNELSTPLFGLFRQSEVPAMLKPWQGRTAPAATEMVSVETAFRSAQAAVPGMRISSAILPGSRFGTSYHYFMWSEGVTPLTSRLFTPVLVDARTGKVTAVVPMPWYLRTLEVSRPLHFGDYGGLPLKILWTILDLATIAVLVSGLVLWFGKRRQSTDARLRALGFDVDDVGDASLPAPAEARQ